MSKKGKKYSIKGEIAQDALSYAKEHKRTAIVYVILRISVILVMIAEIFNQNWNNVFLCILTLVLFLLPVFVDKKLHISLPNTLEIVILLFIYSAEILGEINEYYLHFTGWDSMLHTMNGFLMAAIGFSLVDILNQSDRFSIKLSPFFVALVSFCFSMTVGVLWEFFEFGMDVFAHTDMQKDTILPVISSVMLNPEGRNVAVTVPVESMIVNGETWNFGGYLDIGLYDTMSDLFVNFIGAVVFSALGVMYLRGRGKGTFIARFIPRMKSPERIREEEEAQRVMQNMRKKEREEELERFAEDAVSRYRQLEDRKENEKTDH